MYLVDPRISSDPHVRLPSNRNGVQFGVKSGVILISYENYICTITYEISDKIFK